MDPTDSHQGLTFPLFMNNKVDHLHISGPLANRLANPNTITKEGQRIWSNLGVNHQLMNLIWPQWMTIHSLSLVKLSKTFYQSRHNAGFHFIHCGLIYFVTISTKLLMVSKFSKTIEAIWWETSMPTTNKLILAWTDISKLRFQIQFQLFFIFHQLYYI